MRIVEKALEYLKTVDGVLDAFVMDDDISNKIWDIERSVTTTIDSDYKNVGYDMAMERGHRICLFYDDTYIFGIRSKLKLMSSDGTVMGFTLHPDEIEQYKGKDDIIWVSEDFIVFPDIVGSGDEVFVLYPSEIHEMEDDVPGVKNAIGTSPTMSSDTLLKTTFNKPMVKGIYTFIIAFDC